MTDSVVWLSLITLRQIYKEEMGQKNTKKKLEEKMHTRKINVIQSRLVMKEIKKLRRCLIQIG